MGPDGRLDGGRRVGDVHVAASLEQVYDRAVPGALLEYHDVGRPKE
jgi:hypothetical protein